MKYAKKFAALPVEESSRVGLLKHLTWYTHLKSCNIFQISHADKRLPDQVLNDKKRPYHFVNFYGPADDG